MNKKIIFLLLCLCQACFAHAQKIYGIGSPDKSILLKFVSSQTCQVSYSVIYKGKNVIMPSSLGFALIKPVAQLTLFSVVSVDSSAFDDTWKPVWGEVSQIRNSYSELRVSLRDNSSLAVLVNVIFRVFNDSVGFRYEFPQQPSLQHFVVADELTQFAMTGDHKTFWMPGDFDSNEFLYWTS